MAYSKQAKWYVVWEGRQVGVFTTWPECKSQVDGFPGARFKSFASLEQAERAFSGRRSEAGSRKKAAGRKSATRRTRGPGGPILDSLSVDAACSGNPGVMEYQCVQTATRTEVFKKGPFRVGTNNIGEFLAIVDALVYCDEHQLAVPIYSDSKIGISWVRAGTCRTTLPLETVPDLGILIRDAESWLKSHHYPRKNLRWWPTRSWGEIPADFGRK